MEPDGPEVIPCSVPAAAGSRLHFSWGCGTQLRLVELASPATGAGGEDPYGAMCEWCGACVTAHNSSSSWKDCVAEA